MGFQLTVHKKQTLRGDYYRVYDTAGELVIFSKRPLSFDGSVVDYYSDEERKNKLFKVEEKSQFEARSKYFVTAYGGRSFGSFKRSESTEFPSWDLLGEKENIIMTLKENDPTLSKLHTYSKKIPLIGIILQLILTILNYHLELRSMDGELLGTYQKSKLFKEEYTLKLADKECQNKNWQVLAGFIITVDQLAAIK